MSAPGPLDIFGLDSEVAALDENSARRSRAR